MTVSINKAQEKIVASLRDKIISMPLGSRLELVHRPPMYHGGKPELEQFYLKPLIALVPELNFPGVELRCPKCEHIVARKGFNNNPAARYIHDLHSGMYLLQVRPFKMLSMLLFTFSLLGQV
jgi:hypothetical protein